MRACILEFGPGATDGWLAPGDTLCVDDTLCVGDTIELTIDRLGALTTPIR